MTGTESRSLHVGARIFWRDNKEDRGTVTATNWSGVTLKWDNRAEQSILHNDMQMVSQIK
jgi:hypothetical protein